MITWLVGENSFEIREALKSIEKQFNGRSEHIDGTNISLAQLPDLLMGVSLFTSERLVIISDISQNKPLWEKLPDWLPRVNDTIHIVFVDTKPDKRTASYKALKTVADIHEFILWTDRDIQKAEQWVGERAKQYSLVLDKKTVQHLVTRVGLDQWQLVQALEVLSLLGTVTSESIDDIIPPNLQENIFQLFETALEGKSEEAVRILNALMLREDPYALFALLTSQALTLAAVTYADETNNPTKDFAIHPFVASKLARHGKTLGRTKVANIVAAFATTDADMKRSKAEPWLLIERTLLEVAQIKRTS
ncbi:MAG: DNA polymerase III subunit delta [Candidatus Microsaccharimonas sp.]